MPGMLDNINKDKFIRDYGEAVEYPPEDWNDADDHQGIAPSARTGAKAGRADARGRQRRSGGSASSANLSQTDTGGGLNALQLLLGNSNQGGGP